MKEFVSKTEACKMLEITRPTLDNWIKKKIINEFKIGLSPKIKISEIKKILNPSLDS